MTGCHFHLSTLRSAKCCSKKKPFIYISQRKFIPYNGLILKKNSHWLHFQAVFLAVYVYFGICLISRQIIITNREDAPNKSEVSPSYTKRNYNYKSLRPQWRHTFYYLQIDLYLPIMTIIQFFFFTGWVKVAQGLLNPFGTDDDDFECNYLLDKNLAVSKHLKFTKCKKIFLKVKSA